MKNIAKYLFVAVMAAFTLAACEKEKENELLNPQGSPVKFTFSAAATSETEATLKVVSDVPVPADVTIAVAADATNNMLGMTFPSELVMAKGTSEVTGKLTVDKDALTPEVQYKAVLVASVAGTPFGTVSPLSIKLPKPAPVTVDGNAAEWAKLPSDYVTELVCAGDAELKGLKSAKIFYEDKLYMLLEVSDDALAKGVADGKLRFHVYFDNGNNGDKGYKGKIDCMLEGKMTNGGEWCALSSKYQQWTGTDPETWGGSWTAADASPAFTFAGNGNFYECAMDYSNYPGGLADVIGVGFDIQDGNYVAMGYLPSNDAVAQVVKNGKEIPAAPEVSIKIDGDFSEWKTIEGKSGDGALKAMKMKELDDMVYFYLEVAKTDELKTDAGMAFAHQVMLCFDNGDGQGEYSSDAWGGAHYDKIIEIWLMQNGVPNMITWSLEGFVHKEADGDVQKYEFGFKKSSDAIFSGAKLCYGAYINNRTCDNSSGSEVWDGEATTRIGSAPAADHAMAYRGEIPAVSVDGDLSEWIAFDGVCHGSYGMFKAASDADNIYFYSHRTTEGRFSSLWGVEVGYIYIAFDLDGDPTNGETLNGQGPYDFVGFFYCFGGTAAAPVIEITHEGGAAPEPYTVNNIKVKGIVDETGAKLEYCFPRKDLPAIPNAEITITSWGNKDLSKVQLKTTL